VALAGVEHVGRIEVIDAVLDDDGAAVDPGGQGVPHRRAVHERGRGQVARWRSRADGHQLVERLVVGAVLAPDAECGHQEVGLAPQHALG
jgi:hypothetical protein